MLRGHGVSPAKMTVSSSEGSARKPDCPSRFRSRSRNAGDIQAGDIVEVRDQTRAGPDSRTAATLGRADGCERTLDERRFRAIQTRTRVEGAIREFFLEAGFSGNPHSSARPLARNGNSYPSVSRRRDLSSDFARIRDEAASRRRPRKDFPDLLGIS